MNKISRNIWFLAMLISFQVVAFEDLHSWPARFSQVEVIQLETSLAADIELGTDLVFVIERNSGFDQMMIEGHLQEIQLVYRQCQVGFEKVWLVFLEDELKGKYSRFEFKTPDSLESLREAMPIAQEIPVFMMVHSMTDSPNMSGLSFARWTTGFGQRPSLFNSMVLTNVILGEPYQRLNNGRYNVLAHELMHVLTRNGMHIAPDFRDLMSVSSARTNIIGEQTCSRLHQNQEVLRPVSQE